MPALNPDEAVDPTRCLGHQPIDPTLPTYIPNPNHSPGSNTPTTLEVHDLGVELSGGNCWNCGATPGNPLALFDDLIAGEPMCYSCASKHNAYWRITDDGYNY